MTVQFSPLVAYSRYIEGMLPTVEILKHGASSVSCDSYSRIRPSGWIVVYLVSISRSETRSGQLRSRTKVAISDDFEPQRGIEMSSSYDFSRDFGRRGAVLGSDPGLGIRRLARRLGGLVI